MEFLYNKANAQAYIMIIIHNIEVSCKKNLNCINIMHLSMCCDDKNRQ